MSSSWEESGEVWESVKEVEAGQDIFRASGRLFIGNEEFYGFGGLTSKDIDLILASISEGLRQKD